jgi:hypothetical protein
LALKTEKQREEKMANGSARSLAVHLLPSRLLKKHFSGGTMEPTFAAAIEHIKVMEARIRQQTEAICLLKTLGQDTSDADRRLNLLNFALEELRIQLAQLAPTAGQAKAPAWPLPLVSSIVPQV